MKFTDKFFEMPIRIYDGMSLRKSYKQEEVTGEMPEPLYILGKIKVPADDLYSMKWNDFYGGEIEEALERNDHRTGAGFDHTMVRVGGEDFMVPLPRREFEERVNKFMEIIETEAKKQFEEKQKLFGSVFEIKNQE